MNRRVSIVVCGVLVGAGLGLSGDALARKQQQGQTGQGTQEQPPSAAAAEMKTETVTVETVDKSNRKVTVKKPDGERVTVQVPEEVRAFDKIKPQDRIQVQYMQSVALNVGKPGTSKPDMQERMAVSRTGTAEMPGGMVVNQMTVSAEITKIDKKTNKITFRGPKGDTQTTTVQDPAIQARIKDLKVGDIVELTYTEARAAQLMPPAGKGGAEPGTPAPSGY